MTLTPLQALVIVGMVTLGTVITRFLPFILFTDNRGNYPYIKYLGDVLPYAAIGLLVVYCLKGVDLTNSPFGFPEAAAIICISILHCWKNNALLSIGGGTAIYMLLVQMVFK
jgi:branched-subunit amino acid transport protein AzlD